MTLSTVAVTFLPMELFFHALFILVAALFKFLAIEVPCHQVFADWMPSATVSFPLMTTDSPSSILSFALSHKEGDLIPGRLVLALLKLPQVLEQEALPVMAWVLLPP